MKTTELYRDKLSESDQSLVEKIERDAEQTPAKNKGLAIHLRAIEMLRAKGYSYRDIADWFKERGLKVNHVDVWRAHSKGVESTELFDLAEHDEEWSEFLQKKETGNSTTYEEREVQTEEGSTKQEPAAGITVPSSPQSERQTGTSTERTKRPAKSR